MRRQKKIPWNEIIGRFKGSEDAASKSRLEKWLGSNPLNRSLFDELSSLWGTMSDMEGCDVDVEAAWAKVSPVAIPSRGMSGAKHRLLRNVAVSAAAAIVLFVSGYMLSDFSETEPLTIDRYTSLKGRSDVTLSDGTDICLKDNASISLEESRQSGKRVVSLSGEAFFDVAKKSGQPFVVRSGVVDIRVYGTKFNVRTEKGSQSVLVSLMEGSVSLESQSGELVLSPGEIARCSPDGSITLVPGDILNENCWMNDSIEFKGWTLGEVCNCLSRWYDIAISVEDSIKDSFRYNFSLRDDRLEDVLSMMSLVSPIRYAYLLDGSVRITKSKTDK